MKTKKRLSILFALIAAAICMFTLAACGTKGGGASGTPTNDGELYDPSKDAAKQSLTVAPVQTVELGDEITLKANTANISGELYWRSGDEGVATVNKNGKVTTRNVGVTDITVYGGSLSATCKLTVTETAAVPVVKLDASEITLGVGTAYTVNVSGVTHKNKTADVTDFKWTCKDIADDVIGLNANGGAHAEITAKNVGETEIYVSCKVYGNIGTATVKVKVVDTSTVDIKGLEYGGGVYTAVAYTCEYKRLGYDCSTEIPIETVIYKNGVKVDEEPAFSIEDESVAKVENGKIIGLKEGQTVIYCSYENTKKTINFKCVRPTVVLNGQTNTVVDCATSNRLALTQTADIVGNISKVMFKNGDDADYIEAGSYSGGDIVINDSLRTAEIGGGTFKLVTENIDYLFDGGIYTMVIDSAEKLNRLNDVSKSKSAKADVYDGYFVLAADLVLSESFSFNEVAVGVIANGSNGFVGVFDGNSHIISGLSVKNGGMFAVTGNSAVIKNAVFKNACVTDSGFISSKGGGKVKNVYVDYKKITVTDGCAGFVGTFFVNNGKTEKDCVATVENCVIISHNAAYESADLSYEKLFILGGTSNEGGGVYSNVLATVKMSIKNKRPTSFNAKAYPNTEDGYLIALSGKEIGEKLTTFDKKWDKSFWSLDGDSCPVPKATLAEESV